MLRALKGHSPRKDYFSLVDRVLASIVSEGWVEFCDLLAAELPEAPGAPKPLSEKANAKDTEAHEKKMAEYKKEKPAWEEKLQNLSSGIFQNAREFLLMQKVRTACVGRMTKELVVGEGRMVDFVGVTSIAGTPSRGSRGTTRP